MSRTGQCRHEWTQKTKTARDGTPEPKKHIANCRQTESNQPSVKDTGNNHQSYQDPPDTVRRNTKFPLFKAAHRPRQSRQHVKLGSSAVAVHRRGHRDPCLDAEAAWIQKIVEILQLQYTDEKVDITAESSEVSVDAAGSVQREAG